MYWEKTRQGCDVFSSSCPPTGPARSGRPDDKLRRAPSKHRSFREYWVPAFAGTTGGLDDGGQAQANLALTARLTDFAHSPASIFLPSAGCTRVTLKRPSAQTTVKPSASTTAISPTLPAIPFGSFAGNGLASKIFNCLPSSVVQAPGAGLQPRISCTTWKHGLPQSILALSGPQRPS